MTTMPHDSKTITDKQSARLTLHLHWTRSLTACDLLVFPTHHYSAISQI